MRKMLTCKAKRVHVSDSIHDHISDSLRISIGRDGQFEFVVRHVNDWDKYQVN